MKYLDDLELQKVIAFNEDEVMKEAVRKVLFEGILAAGIAKAGVPFEDKNWAYNLGGFNDFAMDDDKVGALLKATSKGIAFMEDGFKRLSEIKREEPDVSEVNNPAE